MIPSFQLPVMPLKATSLWFLYFPISISHLSLCLSFWLLFCLPAFFLSICFFLSVILLFLPVCHSCVSFFILLSVCRSFPFILFFCQLFVFLSFQLFYLYMLFIILFLSFHSFCLLFFSICLSFFSFIRSFFISVICCSFVLSFTSYLLTVSFFFCCSVFLPLFLCLRSFSFFCHLSLSLSHLAAVCL